MKLTETGYAKINLGLDVLGLRPDRYHEVAMVMQGISLADTVTITENPELLVTTDLPGLEGGPSNLAWKAAVLMGEYAHRAPKVHIHIEKKVFLAAGLAGGSTDAAAVLRGLNRYWELGLPAEKLERLGAKLGSDVPFCVAGGTALATGRGEVLEALPDLPALYLVLGKPKLEISTPWAYREFDKQKNVIHPDIDGMVQAVRAGDVQGVLRRCGNVLEPVTAGTHPEIREIQRQMLQNGAVPVLMSGSGPTVFGFVKDKEEGERIASILQSLQLETAVAKLVGRNTV
ncbi:MAG: 4-(cytidine 5'-diphospho)-2-C-methyl-D-erythritol kinase [Acidaminococcaceae bacterium]|nr:4-(cytidine 5'-diphospho)-2-C-methyl-D-erythritol kinase [Acidaminococcaceae bacterium]